MSIIRLKNKKYDINIFTYGRIKGIPSRASRVGILFKIMNSEKRVLKPDEVIRENLKRYVFEASDYAINSKKKKKYYIVEIICDKLSKDQKQLVYDIFFV